MGETICFKCRRLSSCKFHMSFFYDKEEGMSYQPIDGWTIVETDNGVCVIKCPKFVRCAYTRHDIIEELGISERTYYRNRARILAQLRAKGYRIVRI